MIQLDRLKVSLTKNGYLKLADLVMLHSRFDILDNCESSPDHPEINIKRNQVVKILSADPGNGEVPAVWDEIREHGRDAASCFTLIAVIFSHNRLIDLFRNSAQAAYRGHFRRSDLTQEKEFTNLKYSLESLDLCGKGKGHEGVTYDFGKLIRVLRNAGPLVKVLIELKLKAAGWSTSPRSTEGDFWDVCEAHRLHDVFSMEQEQFFQWMRGDAGFSESIAPL